MEKDDEVKGSGNSYDFGARLYDARLGRFLSLDPKSAHFPWQSPLVFAANNPIAFIDYKGESPGDPPPPGHTGLAGLYITRTVIYVDGVKVPSRRNKVTGENYEEGEFAVKGDITKSTRVSTITRIVIYHTNKNTGPDKPFIVKYENEPSDPLELKTTSAPGVTSYKNYLDGLGQDYSFRDDDGSVDQFIERNEGVLGEDSNVGTVNIVYRTNSSEFTDLQTKNIKSLTRKIKSRLRKEYGRDLKVNVAFVTNADPQIGAVTLESAIKIYEVVGKYKETYEQAQENDSER